MGCSRNSKDVKNTGNRIFDLFFLTDFEGPQNPFLSNLRGNLARSARHNVRSFEKGLAVRGGCREEILPVSEIEESFLTSFPMPA